MKFLDWNYDMMTRYRLTYLWVAIPGITPIAAMSYCYYLKPTHIYWSGAVEWYAGWFVIFLLLRWADRKLYRDEERKYMKAHPEYIHKKMNEWLGRNV